MNTLHLLVLISSALFAWSMGSHYTGSVAGTAYGARVLTLRTALLITAVFTLIGSVAGSINVVDTYTKVVPQASTVDIVAAQLSAAVMTTASTYFKLPTSTIQLYAFSLLGSALVGGLSINGTVFALIVVGWIGGPLVAFVLGLVLSRLGGSLAAKGERALKWFLIGVAIYSAFILGSNDVSNAAASLVTTGQFSPRIAGLFGGAFMALGVLTWGARMLSRIGHDILPLDVQMAATAQFSKALALSGANALGYNASINQTIVAGLIGVGVAQHENNLNRKVARNIIINWTLSPALGLGVSALVTVILHTILTAR